MNERKTGLINASVSASTASAGKWFPGAYSEMTLHYCRFYWRPAELAARKRKVILKTNAKVTTWQRYSVVPREP